MEANWFYEKERQRLGPVSESNLRELVRNGVLNGDNLVWTDSFGTDWKAIRFTDLMEKISGPPPLPTTHIDNTLAWVIALVPIIGAVIELAISQQVNIPVWGIIGGYLVSYIVLVQIDVRRIKASGNSVDTTQFENWWLLIPVYLFKRANSLKQSKAYFWTWFGAIVIGSVIGGDAKAIFDKDTYWGAGLPACDSNYMKTQTQQIFREIPLMKLRGIVALEVKNAQQLSGNTKQKKCTAAFVTSLGTDLQGTYTITMQENDQFYTSLEFE